MLKPPFKFSLDDPAPLAGFAAGASGDSRDTAARRQGEGTMTEVVISEAIAIADLPMPSSAKEMFDRGMMYASDRAAPADLVSAHQWFNLAAMLGCVEAAQLRREIAAEMTDAQIGQAQRAARDWLKQNPVARAPQRPQLRAAA